jgi:hypothetical protein
VYDNDRQGTLRRRVRDTNHKFHQQLILFVSRVAAVDLRPEPLSFLPEVLHGTYPSGDTTCLHSCIWVHGEGIVWRWSRR